MAEAVLALPAGLAFVCLNGSCKVPLTLTLLGHCVRVNYMFGSGCQPRIAPGPYLPFSTAVEIRARASAAAAERHTDAAL
jgi:hypothetical protein